MLTLNNVSNVAKCGALAVSIVAVFVAVSAALALITEESGAGSELKSHSGKRWRDYSFFVDQRDQNSQILSQKSQSLLKRLEFMVWPQTRIESSNEYAQSLRRQINLRPFNAELWEQLVYAQSEVGTEPDQQLWSMRRGLSLSRWNARTRALITRPCVVDYARIMDGEGRLLCSQLLARLPANKSVNYLANRLGVRPKPLLDILVELGLRDREGAAR